MFEIFVGDVVFYVSPDQRLTKGTIKSIVSTKEKGKAKHIYTLFDGVAKREGELFLSLKRAKDHFERCNMKVTIPKGFETE